MITHYFVALLALNSGSLQTSWIRDRGDIISFRASAVSSPQIIQSPDSVDLLERGDNRADFARVIELRELMELVKNEKAIILDVRPRIFYRIGHIPRAQSLEAQNIEHEYLRMENLLRTRLAEGHSFVVYCSGVHCGDASKVATFLTEHGYRNVLVFEMGFEGWQNAGKEVEKKEL